MRIPNPTSRVRGRCQVRVDYLREKTIWPVCVSTGGRIEFFHVTPDSLTVDCDWNFETGHPLFWDLHDVLSVVQKRDCVVIGAEQQDLTVEIDKSLERGTVSERVIPRLPGK